ncbi:MAG TPA: serine/threonine-protein kinase [Polyangia bacterium]|nr:serine/threonine-protein kinase [Polyangia bacterium]
MFASIYIFGHLVVAAASLMIALAFAVSAVRVPRSRADLWYSLTFALTAAIALVEMTLTHEPTIVRARIYLALIGILVFFSCVAFHAQYAAGVFSPRGHRRHAVGVLAYGGFCAVIIACILGGIFDDERLVPLSIHGVRSGFMALPGWAFAMCMTYACLSFVLQVALLTRDGERRLERRIIAVPVLCIPVIGLHELLIGLGVNPMLPLGGYFAALAGMAGPFILAERFRTSSQLHGGNVGRYQLERRLGGGGMADVYLARRDGHERLAHVVQHVALKRLRPEMAEDPHFVRMFLDEARLVAKLRHPHIVTLIEAGEAAGELYLAMELVDGAALSRVIRVARSQARPIAAAAAVEVGLAVADALAHAHQLAGDNDAPLDIVHRDVSPQNILVDRHGHVKLTDFGIARCTERHSDTATGMMKGKLAYMAPEQLRDGHGYDQRVDVWALGVVLYELVSGRPPWEGESEASIMRQLLANTSQPRERAAKLGGPLGDVIAGALTSEPSARVASAARLRDELRALRDEPRGRAELASLVAESLAQDERRTHETAATVAELRRSS